MIKYIKYISNGNFFAKKNEVDPEKLMKGTLVTA